MRMPIDFLAIEFSELSRFQGVFSGAEALLLKHNDREKMAFSLYFCPRCPKLGDWWAPANAIHAAAALDDVQDAISLPLRM